jgi:hypothetical protein
LDTEEATQCIETAKDILSKLLPKIGDHPSVGCAADVFNVMYLLGNHNVDAACLQNHFNRYASPYFDLDYVAQISKVPERQRWKQAPQYAVVRAHAPQWIDIPRCYSDVKTFGGSNPYIARIPVAFHRKVVPVLKRFIPETLVRKIDPYQPSMGYAEWFRDELRDEVMNLPSKIDRFDKTKLKLFVTSYLTGETDDHASIGFLLTLASRSAIFR